MIHLPHLTNIERMSEQELRAAYAQILTALNTVHHPQEYALLLSLRHRITAALNRKRPQPRP